MLRRRTLAGLALLALTAGCGVRAPAPLDVSALVRESGDAGARGRLEVRILDNPRDVQARLALAKLADETGRPGQALEQLEAVLRLGGPLGTRWHDADRARMARLLAARGRARLAREATTALEDLKRARSFGAAIDDDELLRARLAVAIWALRHVDANERERGRRLLVELVDTPIAHSSWRGALPDAAPRERGRFGVWLWEHGARRAAWEALASWRARSTEQGGPLHDAYLRAYAWWHPLDAAPPPAEQLVGPARCWFPVAACAAPRETPAPPDLEESPARERLAPFDAAALAYVRARSPGGVATAGATTVESVIAAYRRDPAIAERLARDLVAEAIDTAAASALVGALFDVLGDPARARAAWEAAALASAEPPFVRGLAVAMARANDPDAALIHATTAAAASGDPALVWIEVAHALGAPRGEAHAMEAARYALELAGADAIADALDVAITASAALGRTAQADALRARRAALAPTLGAPETAATRALAAHAHEPTASTVADLWVASRAHPRDVPTRAALYRALAADDPRRAAVAAELVSLAGDPDPRTGRAAVLALRP